MVTLRSNSLHHSPCRLWAKLGPGTITWSIWRAAPNRSPTPPSAGSSMDATSRMTTISAWTPSTERAPSRYLSFSPFFWGGGTGGLKWERRVRCLFDWLIATLLNEEENAFYHVDIVFHSFLLFNFRLKMLCAAGDANRSQLLRDLPLPGHQHSRQGRKGHWIAWGSSSRPSSPNEIRDHYRYVISFWCSTPEKERKKNFLVYFRFKREKESISLYRLFLPEEKKLYFWSIPLMSMSAHWFLLPLFFLDL